MRVVLIIILLGVGAVGILLTFCGMTFLFSPGGELYAKLLFLIPGVVVCGVSVWAINAVVREGQERKVIRRTPPESTASQPFPKQSGKNDP